MSVDGLPVEYFEQQLEELSKKRYWTPFDFRTCSFLKNRISGMKKEE